MYNVNVLDTFKIITLTYIFLVFFIDTHYVQFINNPLILILFIGTILYILLIVDVVLAIVLTIALIITVSKSFDKISRKNHHHSHHKKLPTPAKECNNEKPEHVKQMPKPEKVKNLIKKLAKHVVNEEDENE